MVLVTLCNPDCRSTKIKTIIYKSLNKVLKKKFKTLIDSFRNAFQMEVTKIKSQANLLQNHFVLFFLITFRSQHMNWLLLCIRPDYNIWF